MTISCSSGPIKAVHEALTPVIVGIGGSLASASSSERVLRDVLGDCERRGASTLAFRADDLDLPVYTPLARERSNRATSLVSALRLADTIVVVSPGYHDTLPGFLENALDSAQHLVDDPRPYFKGRPVGLVAVAAGWQTTGTTLSTLRFVTYALRECAGRHHQFGDGGLRSKRCDDRPSDRAQAAGHGRATIDFAANFRSPSQGAFRTKPAAIAATL